MINLQSRIHDYLAAEENRLARLKIFCDAHCTNFYAAKETIAEVCNNHSSSCYILDAEEVQRRFMYAKNHNLNIDLDQEYFWVLADWIMEKREEKINAAQINHDQ